MPTVKWVETGFLLNDVTKLRYASVRQRGMVPVLTLDDVEAWLKNERDRHSNCQRNCFTFDDLLAQVQAMRDRK